MHPFFIGLIIFLVICFIGFLATIIFLAIRGPEKEVVYVEVEGDKKDPPILPEDTGTNTNSGSTYNTGSTYNNPTTNTGSTYNTNNEIIETPPKVYKYVETTDAANNFSCPDYVSNSNVKKDLYCIVPKPFAKQICQSLPNCGGYAETTNAGWNNAFPNSVSLFDNNFRTGTASPEWKSYKQIYE